MNARLLRLMGCSLVGVLCACGDKPSEVELRLYPCALVSGTPMSVELEIRNLDAEGAEIGALLVKTFPIDDPAVFHDDFATVGFRPPAGALTADIKVTWNGGGEQVIATYVVAVPELGASVDLGIEECEGGPGTTTMTSTTTSEPATTSTGPGTTEATTGPSVDTDTDTATTEATTTTGTTEATTSTTDTSTSTTDTSTSTTETSDTDATTGTTGGPMEGEPCAFPDGYTTCDGGPGQLGQFLFCVGGEWVVDDPNPPGEQFCELDDGVCDELGFTSPKIVGCLGDENTWSCACGESQPSQCTMGKESGCGGPLGGGALVELCVVDGTNTWYYAGICPACYEVGGEPLCTL